MDFGKIIDRRNTNSLKYDFAAERGYPADVSPLWVADMDFQAPESVLDALRNAASHGIFGYSEVKDAYFEAVSSWFTRRFGWTPAREWLVKTPGVVFAIAAGIRALTKPGDAVLIQQPVYYPFSQVIKDNDRRLVNNELLYQNGRYAIDFEDFERKIMQEQVKLFILCSPHNPVGRVWSRDELTRLCDICLKYDVFIISDEIHCDFTYDGFSHMILNSIGGDITKKIILCTAPSKTFNLAGLQVSNIFIHDEELRRAFKKEVDKTGYSQLNTMGLVAAEAAYRYGEAWLSELKAYLKSNLDFLKDFLNENIPDIRLVPPEGTYLVWLDCSALRLHGKALDDFIINEAGLWLDSGGIFGDNSHNFQRINIACPKKTLEVALTRLGGAVSRMKKHPQ